MNTTIKGNKRDKCKNKVENCNLQSAAGQRRDFTSCGSFGFAMREPDDQSRQPEAPADGQSEAAKAPGPSDNCGCSGDKMISKIRDQPATNELITTKEIAQSSHLQLAKQNLLASDGSASDEELEDESSDGIGQLVLSVDFAPPSGGLTPTYQLSREAHLSDLGASPSSSRESSIDSTAATNGNETDAGPSLSCAVDSDNDNHNHNEADQINKLDTSDEETRGELVLSHLVEVSLCIKQRPQKQRPSSSDQPALAQIRQDTQNTCDNEGRQRNPSLPDTSGPKKRRIVYERIDKFPLKLNRPKAEPEASRQTKTKDLDCGRQRQVQAGLRLPFASRTFDACFCFNLLNVRVASGQLLALERISRSHEAQPRAKLEEAEKSRLRMGKLTSELRLSLLEELCRVVKPEGKIMVTVFAYECLRRCANATTGVRCKRQEDQLDQLISAKAMNILQSAGKQEHQSSSSWDQQQQQHQQDQESTQLWADQSKNNESNPKEGEQKVDYKYDSCCPKCRLEMNAKKSRRFSHSLGPSIQAASSSGFSAPKAITKGQQEEDKGCDTNTKLDGQSSGLKESSGSIPRLSMASRRYSLALWRAVTNSANDEHQQAISSIGLNERLNDDNPTGAFQIPREIISETAKRLSRRLSSTSSSLMGRLFASTLANQPTESESEYQKTADQEEPQRQDQVSETLNGAKITVQVEHQSQSEHMSEADNKQQATDGSIDLPSTDVIQYLKSQEYTKRHRQSIAVQTFFTKSIADDDQVDILGLEDQNQLASFVSSDIDTHEEPLSETTSSGWTAPSASGCTGDYNSRYEDQTTNDEPKYQTNTNTNTSAERSSSSVAACESANEYNLRHAKLTPRAKSTTDCLFSSNRDNEPQRDSTCHSDFAAGDGSANLRPADLATLASGNSSLSRLTFARDSSAAASRRSADDKWAQNATKFSPADKRSSSSALACLNHHQSVSSSGNEEQNCDLPSDFSSFTLATTTTTGTSASSADQQQQPETSAGKARLASSARGYRCADNLASSSSTTGDSHDLATRPEASNLRDKMTNRRFGYLNNTRHQRRAYSETEAYNTMNSQCPSVLMSQVNQQESSAQTTPTQLQRNCHSDELSANIVNSRRLELSKVGSQLPANLASIQNPAEIPTCAALLRGETNHRLVETIARVRDLPTRRSSAATEMTPSTNMTLNQQQLNSMANLIESHDASGDHIYLPLDNHQVLSGSYQENAEIASGAIQASTREKIVSGAYTARHPSQHQWRQSNTFSSSLNSDISTSGPKDTTEKDSSRRTSTLSGISSIYQQETSIGLGTPAYSHTGSCSTPANSQAAACSGMGSIPELTAADQQHLQQALVASSSVNCAEIETQTTTSRTLRRFTINEQHHSSRFETQTQTDQHQELSRLARNEAAHESFGLANFSSTENQTNVNSDFASTNLQRVAQSLKSQLRERLSTMRPLNAFMGLNVSSNNTNSLDDFPARDREEIHEESPSPVKGQRLDTAKFETTTSSNRNQNKRQVTQALISNSPNNQSPAPSSHFTPSLSSSQSNQRLSSSKTETPTPATLKSFFRSTSSAAFNAFASSFHQSSSSTPTGTTVINQHYSTSSQFAATASISSDVFDPPTSVALGSRQSSTLLNESGDHHRDFFNQDSLAESASLATAAASLQMPASGKASAPSQAPKSPISPISSMTSSRFFARIRDKFNLSSQPDKANSSRPTSAISTSGSVSINATTMIKTSPIHTRASDQIVESPAEHEIPSNDIPVDNEPSLDHNDTSSLSETLNSEFASTNESNRRLSSSSTRTHAGAESTSNTSSRERNQKREPKADDLDQKLPLAASSKCNSRNPMDPFDIHYGRVISLARPTIQRELEGRQLNESEPRAPTDGDNNIPMDTFEHHLQPKSGPDLNSIIRPMNAMYESNRYIVQNNSNSMSSIHLGDLMQANSELIPNNFFGQQDNLRRSTQMDEYLQRQWLDSSQQSIESSSSVRSLRSCWFSMPELYAMNNTESNSPTQQNINLAVAANNLLIPDPPSNMENLLGVLGDKLMPDRLVEGSNSQVNQHQALDWPSNELCRQVTSGDAPPNWTLSDLNLTNDDIAMPKRPVLEVQVEPQEMRQTADAFSRLIKCSTLDDSVCASIKSSSEKEQADMNRTHQAKSSSQQVQISNCSRPTSQNSTISNTSCALSELNSDGQDTKSPVPSRHHSDSGESRANLNPNSPPKDAHEADTKWPPAPEPMPHGLPLISTEISDQVEILHSECSTTRKKSEKEANTNCDQSGLLTADLATYAPKQRAMSLAVDASVPMGGAGLLGDNLSLQALQMQRRRKSAMGNFAPGLDVAPAATTLDLRLAGRRNRVKLTDLHPITFINDKEFLNTMSSLKNASDNKLQAIFDSPVGRRLSVNAEMINQSGQLPGQRSGGIKIGLTGYVYIDDRQGLDESSGLSRSRANEFRRPSLAPNFWRSNIKSPLSPGPTEMQRSSCQNTSQDYNQLCVEGKTRARSASCTPMAMSRALSPGNSESQANGSLGRDSPGSLKVKSGTERRRSTISLLERLSESSVELDNYILKTNDEPPDNPRPSSLGKIGEEVNEPEQVNVRNSKFVPSSPRNSSSESSPESSSPKPKAEVKTNAAGKRLMVDDSSSSDDGDIDKLVSQYASVVPMASIHNPLPSMRFNPSSPTRHSTNSTQRHLTRVTQTAQDNKIVKNDMILKQLLLASNAASVSLNNPIPKSLESSPVRSSRFRSERNQVTGGEFRRFSAINLYQRDEDIFVANSMKRPPSNQFQLLNTLPLLAGTLPLIINESPNLGVGGLGNCESETRTAERLPVLAPSRNSAKSIITGHSGLNSQLNGQNSISLNSSPVHPQNNRLASFSQSKSSSVRSSTVAEVDVEEQLNRLRQQEKRSFGSSSPQHSLTGYSFTAPCNPWTNTPTELKDDDQTVRPKESSFSPSPQPPAPNDDIDNEHENRRDQEALKVTSPPTKLILPPSPSTNQSPPNGIALSTIAVPPTILHLTPRVDPASNYLANKSSVEPFKQLDTIIEGRGLLLGAEQQADPSYTNRLRRLSGNHPRRSSIGNAINQQRRESTGPDTSGTNDDGWCKCDLAPNSRRQSLARLANTRDKSEPQESRLGLEKVTGERPTLQVDDSSAKSVLDTVKSLARRTFNNIATISSRPSFANDLKVDNSRQKRSSSVIVSSSGSSFLNQTNQNQQQVIPSGLLREKARVENRKRELRQKQKLASRAKGNGEISSNYNDDSQSSQSSEDPNGSPDDSSLMSLDDAENYRAKNKENKMGQGQSLESSSSSSSISSSPTISDDEDNGQSRSAATETKSQNGEEGEEFGDEAEDDYDESYNEEEDCDDEEEEEEEDDNDDDDDDDDDDSQPKICYKCNKKIMMESHKVDAHSGEPMRVSPRCEPKSNQSSTSNSDARVNGTTSAEGRAIELLTEECQSPRGVKSSTAGARSGHRRRAARRSASMNAADSEAMSQVHASGSSGHINRRKNKWHIQRNLAPKLKRQRSFSANYAPEVPNPMMPPPRRFSAAPMLTCPHRTKSSSHSSSSLHRTCSIDSSESLITVIPANRDFRRSPRGSLSCNSGQFESSAASSFFGAMPRSPLSPRSPSRCSPGFLTPNPSETQPITIEAPPFSPVTTNTTSGSRMTSQTGEAQHQHHLFTVTPGSPTNHQTIPQSISDEKSTCSDAIQINNENDFIATTPATLASCSSLSLAKFADQDSSLAVENGTSHCSSRTDLTEFLPTHDESRSRFDPDLKFQVDEFIDQVDGLKMDSYSSSSSSSSVGDLRNMDPNLPVICETINNYCARHSQKELEHIVRKVRRLKINDCYYSEMSSTLCMVIETID